MEENTLHLHEKVKKILYSLTGITLSENKDNMIANRLHKLKRDTKFNGDLDALLQHIAKGEFASEFINSFTTNKTHFFREDFHFLDLKNRVLPTFKSKEIKMYCSASSTGEEPYSMAMTVFEAQEENSCKINASIIATDIDTNVLQYAANGVYRFSKSSKEFPEWIQPQKYFKRTEIASLNIRSRSRHPISKTLGARSQNVIFVKKVSVLDQSLRNLF